MTAMPAQNRPCEPETPTLAGRWLRLDLEGIKDEASA